MPMYSTLRAFVSAINTGKTHITESLDAFFSEILRVKEHPRWRLLSSENWSAGPPDWLAEVLDDPAPAGIGLTPPERDHVLAWPGPELEKARGAAARAINGVGAVAPRSPKFFWELYNGNGPRTVIRVSSGGDPEIVFQSPRSAVVVDGDEVFVRDVPLDSSR